MNRHVSTSISRTENVESAAERVFVYRRLAFFEQMIIFLVFMVMGSVFSTVTLAEDENLQLTNEPNEFMHNLYDYGCGPVSVYIAAKQFGVAITLQELLDRGWGDNPHRLSLKELCLLVDTIPGLNAEGVHLAPEDLSKVVSNDSIIAILVIRKDNSDMPNHTVVLEMCDEKGITVLDYPEVRYNISMSSVVDVYDGHAILVKKVEEQTRRISILTISTILACGFLAFGLYARFQRAI